MFDHCLFFNLNTVTRKINRIWDTAFRQIGLSPAHAYCLRVALNQPGITLKYLAQEMNLDPSTVTRFVDALSQRGLAKRGRGTDDRRAFGVYPTDAGRALAERLEATDGELYQAMCELLGEDQVDRINSELRKINTTLRQ